MNARRNCVEDVANSVEFVSSAAATERHHRDKLLSSASLVSKIFSAFNPATEGVSLHQRSAIIQRNNWFIMPPPRRGGGGALSGDRRPSSVCPSVCLSDVAYIGSNSKTKRPRKTKLCTGVPRSHATPTPTSRSKGQKSRSRGQLVHRSEMCQYFANG